MNRLSSCYFCGEALDASLDEYPVVPKALGPTDDHQRHVVLCGDCRRKLGTVMEPVVAAATGDQDEPPAESAESASRDPSPSRDSPAQSTADAADSGDDDDIKSSLEGGEDVLRSVSNGTGDEVEVEGAVGDADDAEEERQTPDEKNADDDDVWVTDPDGQSGADDESSSDSTGSTDSPRSTGSTDSPRSTGSTDSPGSTGSTDSSGSTGSTDSPRSTGSTDSPGSTGSAGRGSSAGDERSVEAETSLTKLEYNKVMRLLQNRQFPVERDGFVNVAANAYELSYPEVEKILDVAIDHGLIGEEDGQLVAGEE